MRCGSQISFQEIDLQRLILSFLRSICNFGVACCIFPLDFGLIWWANTYPTLRPITQCRVPLQTSLELAFCALRRSWMVTEPWLFFLRISRGTRVAATETHLKRRGATASQWFCGRRVGGICRTDSLKRNVADSLPHCQSTRSLHVTSCLSLAKGPCIALQAQGAFRDFSLSTCTHWLHHCIYTCPQLRFLPLVPQPISRSPFQFLETLSLITLLGSNLGTKSYVLRSLWNLLLSNSSLFSPGYTISPRFLSPGIHA